MSYHTNRHSCYDLEYHLVVVTKYRHPVIEGAFKTRLVELTYRILEEDFRCYVNEVNTDKDQIPYPFLRLRLRLRCPLWFVPTKR